MDLTRVRYFYAAATLGGVRQAGEQLHVSAPAISRAIKQLEKDVGRTLFRPAGRGLELTDDGRVVVRWAERVLDEVGALKRMLERSDQPDVVKLGTFEFFMTHALMPLCEVLPPHLVVRDLEPGALEEALVERRVDIGITVRPYPQQGVEHLPAGRFDMGVYALPGRFAGTDPTTTPFVLPLDVVSDSPMHARAQDGWPDERWPRQATYRVDMMESGLELCRRGRVAAFLPSFVVHLHNLTVAPPLRLEPVPWPLPRDVESRYPAFVVRRTSEDGMTVHALAQRVADRLDALFAGVPGELKHEHAPPGAS